MLKRHSGPSDCLLQMQGTGVQASFHFAVLAFFICHGRPPFKYQRRTRQALRLVVLASFARFHQFAQSSPFFNFL